MEEAHFQYDGSFGGILCGAAGAVRRKVLPLSIAKPGEGPAELFFAVIEVETDPAWSERVWKALIDRCGSAKARDLAICHLAGDPAVDHLILRQVIAILKSSPDAFDVRDPVVNTLRQWRKKISHETHHMHAFVRFQENSDGLWTSVIAPAYDVLPLIAPHFKKRFADMRWMIMDERRGYAVHHEEGKLQWAEPLEASSSGLPSNMLAKPVAVEDHYQTLWKTYFHHVNIPERANLKLQMRHMPKRHWRHMVEMVGG